MTTLQKVNRLKNFVEIAGVEVLDVVDLTLGKLLSREQQILQKDSAELEEQLAVFEEQFGMTSAEFYTRYELGQMGDDMDYMEWASLYERRKQMVLGNAEPLEGIQYVTNAKGEPTAVLLDLHLYGDVWEDIHDMLLAWQRAQEPRETLAEVRDLLIREGKLDG